MAILKGRLLRKDFGLNKGTKTSPPVRDIFSRVMLPDPPKFEPAHCQWWVLGTGLWLLVVLGLTCDFVSSQGEDEAVTLKSCTRRKTDSIEKRFCFDVEAVDR